MVGQGGFGGGRGGGRDEGEEAEGDWADPGGGERGGGGLGSKEDGVAEKLDNACRCNLLRVGSSTRLRLRGGRHSSYTDGPKCGSVRETPLSQQMTMAMKCCVNAQGAHASYLRLRKQYGTSGAPMVTLRTTVPINVRAAAARPPAASPGLPPLKISY